MTNITGRTITDIPGVLRVGVEIDGVLYPFSQIPVVAASQAEIDEENAAILAAVAAGEYVG